MSEEEKENENEVSEIVHEEDEKNMTEERT